MTPLIDGDILLYEIGFACERKDEDLPSFDFVQEVLDNRIDGICRAVGATSKPKIFLTGKGNFREALAEKKGYKENRKESKKPFHYNNIKQYLLHSYGAELIEGMEADDAMAIAQSTSVVPTIICSRDKDLRIVPGWHYSWECGKQGELEPYIVEELGSFWTQNMPKKLLGTGLKFFYAQCLMGDIVDNVPGLPNYGPVAAYELLRGSRSRLELETRTYLQYEAVYGHKALQELTEQARLLWMVRELVDGKPVMWEPLDETKRLAEDAERRAMDGGQIQGIHKESVESGDNEVGSNPTSPQESSC